MGGKEFWGSRPGGSAPCTPAWAVGPRPHFICSGSGIDGEANVDVGFRHVALCGSLLNYSGKTTTSTSGHRAEAGLGTDKMGSGAYGPSGVQGQSPWPSSSASE